MLTSIKIRNFKRFAGVDIELGKAVVLIGPNDSGKTTVLQALALWDIGLRMGIVSSLCKIARIANDVSVLASGNPKRIGKRVVNKGGLELLTTPFAEYGGGFDREIGLERRAAQVCGGSAPGTGSNCYNRRPRWAR